MHRPVGIGRNVGHAIQLDLAVWRAGPECIGFKFKMGPRVNAQACTVTEIELAPIELESSTGQYL